MSGDCQEWNVTLHFYDDKWPNQLGPVIDVVCPDVEKHVFAMPSGASLMAIRLVHVPYEDGTVYYECP